MSRPTVGQLEAIGLRLLKIADDIDPQGEDRVAAHVGIFLSKAALEIAQAAFILEEAEGASPDPE